MALKAELTMNRSQPIGWQTEAARPLWVLDHCQALFVHVSRDQIISD